MTRLYFEPDARDAYLRLRDDPTLEGLLEATRRVLDLLAADPGDAAVRQRRFSESLWGVRIRDKAADDWLVLWQEATDETVVVRYLGPDTLA